MTATILAKIAPYLITGEKTFGIPGWIIVAAIIIIVYLLVKKKK